MPNTTRYLSHPRFFWSLIHSFYKYYWVVSNRVGDFVTQVRVIMCSSTLRETEAKSSQILEPHTLDLRGDLMVCERNLVLLQGWGGSTLSFVVCGFWHRLQQCQCFVCFVLTCNYSYLPVGLGGFHLKARMQHLFIHDYWFRSPHKYPGNKTEH
jgi:hypothetical protein